MVSRKALLIGNPGEIGAENYCEGVNRDMENYRDFLKSPLGGFWYDKETEVFHKPSKNDVKQAIQGLKAYDYSKVIFSGHGWYSSINESTFLELNRSESINSMELRSGSKKQSIILDCCREVEKAILLEEERLIKAMKAVRLTPSECRKYYDKRIDECSTGVIVMYGCSIKERAGDDSLRGGYYSSSLISGTMTWFESNSVDLSKSFSIFSVISAHEEASLKVKKLSGGRQNPQIEKPRSAPYFPFAVMA